MGSTAGRSASATAQAHLKRAYLWLGQGYFAEALKACEEAAKIEGGQVMATTLRGAILTASGRPTEGMQCLHRLRRGREESILITLYLAEACFLAGRRRRAKKLLDGIDDRRLKDSEWLGFAQQLRNCWRELEELDELPQLHVVSLEAQSHAVTDTQQGEDR